MSKPRIVLVGGWGQTADVFVPLVSKLTEWAEVEVTSVYQLAYQWQASGKQLTTNTPATEISNYAQELKREAPK